MIKLTTHYLATCLTLLLSTFISAQTTVNFNYTGGPQSWTVPACVTSITVVVEGAEGGDNGNGAGGNGAVITAAIPVIPGQVISLIVGGEGSAPAGGYNGGGNGNLSSNGNNNYNSNGGGGASTISIGGVPVVIAAGGGGAGGGSNNVAGGNGGCASGSPGANTYGAGGGGASQFAGGSGGTPWAGTPPGGQNGSYGQGGNGGPWQTASGGGGGGGYYGGGGGGNDGCCTGANGGGGGGGGSSLVPAGAGCVAGSNTGNGVISITYAGALAATASNTGPYCGGQTIQLNATGGTDYSWVGPNGFTSNLQNPTIPAATVADGGVYTVTVTDAACPGSSNASTTVVVNPMPTVNPISGQTLCNSALTNAVNFTGAVPGTNYDWTNNTTSIGLSASGTGNIPSFSASNPNLGTTITSTVTVTPTANGCTGATQSFTITVNNTVPTLNCPGNLTATCSITEQPPYSDLAAFTAAGGSANSLGGTILPATFTLVSEISDGNSCPQSVTRTYSINDDCGNVATCQQTIIIDDNINPTGSNPAAQIGVPPPPNVNVVTDEADNCGTPLVTFIGDVSNGGICPEIITRTYRITDACGNFIDVTQTFTVGDAIFPTASNPIAVNVECSAPAPDPLVVTDEADNGTTPIVTWDNDATDGLSCPETITRTYKVTDDCGNFIFVTQTITIEDITAPVLAAPPVAVTVQCVGDIPPMTNLGWTDNCDGAGSVAGTDGAIVGGNCGGTITRTWTYTDACGNNATVTQTITIDDNIAPVFAAPPATITVPCIGDVPTMTNLGWTDNCDGAGSVAGTDGPLVGGECGGTIIRTWTYSDACGNVSSTTQTITVDDTTPPTASNPMGVNVECLNDVPVSDITVVTTEMDNCTANPIVAFVSEVSDGNTCPEVITRTYSVTDDCGNQITVTQTITVNDITNPTASNPAPISVAGAILVPGPDPSVVTDEDDNCSTYPLVAWVSDVSDGNICNQEEITRTYSVTDDCGNQILVTQIIIIEAVPPPVNAGADELICDGETMTLAAGNPSGAAISWDNGGTDGQAFIPVSTATYTVTADLYGCLSTDDVTITIEPLPVVSFTEDHSDVCLPVSATFINTSTTSGSLANCIWNIEGVSPLSGCDSLVYTFQNSGLYDVTLTTTSANGCTNSTTYTDYIYVESMPVASFTASSTELSNLMSTVDFTNTSIGASNYVWDFGDGSATTTIVNPTHIYAPEVVGSFEVELIAYTPAGCTDTASLAIHVREELIFNIPNTFTPDGDSYNQTFQPIVFSGYDPYDFTMFIFNRWGEIVFETHNVEVGWDGTYAGKLMSDGVYTWKIEFKTNKNDERVMVTGHVNMIR